MPDASATPTWSLYLIRCKNGDLYTGITTDVVRRFSEHQSSNGRCAKFLRGRGPLKIAFQESIGSRSDASKLEYCIKQLTRTNKEKLVSGDLSLTEVYANTVTPL